MSYKMIKGFIIESFNFISIYKKIVSGLFFGIIFVFRFFKDVFIKDFI